MKRHQLCAMAALLLATTAGHAESVYKLKDATGATVYSDRPNLPGTTNGGTVRLPPGPSVEQRQAAEQQVQQMEAKSNELKADRLAREQTSRETREKTTATAEEIESSGVGVVDRRHWRDPKARIPVESPDAGEHPIYTPRKDRPAHAIPRPGARPARR